MALHTQPKNEGQNNVKTEDVLPLMKAVEDNHLDEFLNLLKSGADATAVNESGESCLTAAASLRHLEMTKALIASGADINTACPRGTTALMAASQNGQLHTVQLLIDSNADVNIHSKSGATALISAVEKGHTDIAELLLLRGADVNAARADGNTALLLASERGSVPMVRILLENGCNINAQNKDGFTASLIAADKSHRDVLKLLCDYKADMDLPCLYGYTPVFVAVLKHDVAALELIIDSGCDTNVTDNLGLTSLMHASWQGRHELVRVFCELGTNVNIQNPKNGRTALHYGVIKNNLTVVKYLVDAKACLNVIDRASKTPLDLAMPGQVRDFLISVGAYECGLRRESSFCSGSLRSSHLSLRSVTSFEKFYTDAHKVPNKVIATVKYSFNEDTMTPENASELESNKWPDALPSPNQTLPFTDISEPLSQPLPLPVETLTVQPDTQSTVEAFAMDKVKLRDYLQRCVEHYLAQHIAGNGCATFTSFVETEKTEQPENTQTRDDGMRVNNITQNIYFTIGTAMCVNTGSNGRIIIADRDIDSFISTVTEPEVDYDIEEYDNANSEEFFFRHTKTF
ncbi:unnamed protein product [Lymnaea stagnalis]|uniref:Ankyrin repeat protein n=1 Tax=Lymnaea stagnalis TaxID=6523 RepID=A0AAV2I2R3_LYMST